MKPKAVANEVISAVLDSLRAEIAALREEMSALRRLISSRGSPAAPGYLDAKAAAEYCGMSRGTFDKYRYRTAVKIRGFRLDGKVLYRRDDLDEFIRLYEIRSKNS
jgi:Helix-turn-helix domain